MFVYIGDPLTKSSPPSMSNVARVATVLKAIPFLCGIDDALIDAAAPDIEIRTYAEGEIILRIGSALDGLHVITEGRASMLKKAQHGREAILEELGKHDFVGEAACLQEQVSTDIVQAQTDCVTLYIPRAVLLKFVKESTCAAVLIMHALVQRLAHARRKLGNLAIQIAYARVLEVLLERGHEQNGEWCVEVSSTETAMLTGSSRETVNGVLRDLVSRRLVRRTRSKIMAARRAAGVSPT